MKVEVYSGRSNMCNSVYKQTYCELPEGHEGAHRALIIEKPYSTRVEWNYACPTCHQEKPLDVIYINRLGMCQECAAQQCVKSDDGGQQPFAKPLPSNVFGLRFSPVAPNAHHRGLR